MKKFKELKQEAKKLNACDKGLAKWCELQDDLDLVKKYVKEIEFCAKHDFPSVEYIKKNYPEQFIIADARDASPCECSTFGRG